MMIFETRPISLSTLFKNKTPFVIPDYQRNYKWDENTINILLEDIYSEFKEYLDYDKKHPELQPIYFLGSILTISIDNKNELYNAFREAADDLIMPPAFFAIIDGQQRITTFSLIAIALHRKIREIYNCNCVKINEVDTEINTEINNVLKSNTIPLSQQITPEINTEINNVLKSLKCFFSKNISCTEESKPIILRQGQDKYVNKLNTKSDMFSYQENYIKEINGQEKTNNSSTNSLEQPKWIDSKLTDLFVKFAKCFEKDYNSPFEITCRNEEIRRTMEIWNNYINKGECSDKCSCFNKFREEDFRNDKKKIEELLIEELLNENLKNKSSKRDKKTINHLNYLLDRCGRKTLENKFGNLPKCKIGKLKELLFYYLFAKYFEEYCQVVLIESKRIDFSYDIFQSLNAKGTPLTSIEVFNAYLSAKNDSDSSKFIKDISKHLDETKQESLVSDMLTDLAYVYNGNKLAERFKEQVDYLQECYKKDKDTFINTFKDLYIYYLNYWLFTFSNKEDQENENLSNLLKGYKLEDESIILEDESIINDKKEALTCLHFLKDSAHDKSKIVLILFFIKNKNSKNNVIFKNAIKAVTAFSILYRVIQGNKGLPDVYNDFMKKNNIDKLKNNANTNTDDLLKDLKDHLKESLRKIELILPNNDSTPQYDIPLSFSQDEFKNDLSIKNLVENLKKDKIIPDSMKVDDVDALNKLLSSSIEYKLYEKILCGKDDSNINQDIKDLKNEYETDNTDEKQNKLKKLNRYVLKEFYPDVTPKTNDLNNDFNYDDFNDTLTIAGLVNKLKKDKIIPDSMKVDDVDALNKLLSSSIEYKLYEKILCGKDDSNINQDIKVLKNDYETDNTNEKQNKLKKLNRYVLEQFYPDVTPKSIYTNWLFMSDKKIAYNLNKTICKFCLFLYFDNQTAEIVNNQTTGLMTQSNESVTGGTKYLTPDVWQHAALKELEHVAPADRGNNNDWDDNIYNNNVQHDIGNLLLLPRSLNASASNKPFKDKVIYFQTIADKSQTDREGKIKEAFSDKVVDILLNTPYVSGFEPFKNLGDSFKWDLEFIKSRSQQIRKVVFNRLWDWLK